MNNLGLLYLNGTGVQRDIDLARTWFEKAITLDNAEAQKSLKYLEEAALLDGTQVGARRASCMETCQTLHRSYVTSACDRYSATADGDNPERTKCVGMSLMLAQRCRASCREMAPAALADNKCAACFQTLIACSIGPEPPDSQGNEKPYAVDTKACLAASAVCAAGCRGQMAPASGTPEATGAKPN
jgi:TPR repeat protein